MYSTCSYPHLPPHSPATHQTHLLQSEGQTEQGHGVKRGNRRDLTVMGPVWLNYHRKKMRCSPTACSEIYYILYIKYKMRNLWSTFMTEVNFLVMHSAVYAWAEDPIEFTFRDAQFLVYTKKRNFICDHCWQNESECTKSNFELQAKEVKNVSFGRMLQIVIKHLKLSLYVRFWMFRKL